MRLFSRSIAVIAMLLVMFVSAASIQISAQTAPSGAHDAEVAATLAKATAVRDAFVAHIHAAGFSCPIPVPTILVEDVPSFGQYDNKTNVIRTSTCNRTQFYRHVLNRLVEPGRRDDHTVLSWHQLRRQELPIRPN